MDKIGEIESDSLFVMVGQTSLLTEAQGRLIQISLMEICTEGSKTNRKTARKRQVRKTVFNMHEKASSTFKSLRNQASLSKQKDKRSRCDK